MDRVKPIAENFTMARLDLGYPEFWRPVDPQIMLIISGMTIVLGMEQVQQRPKLDIDTQRIWIHLTRSPKIIL